MEESTQIKKALADSQTQTRRPKIILRCSRSGLSKTESPALEQASSSIVSKAGIDNYELRCDPDPFHPGLAQCTAQVDDDRQGISHFFGRNKKATASIPQECFPLMCRIHYQEKGYRWGKDSPGIFADFQCGCIIKTLENMYQLTFTDGEGNNWPWFCGLRLQVPMPKERKPTSSKSNGNDELDDQELVVEQLDKYEATLDNMPLWLRGLVTKHPRDTRYSPSDHPNGVQYDIPQMIAIVRSIGKYCVDNEVKLPKIEAIPITLGMHFEQELDKIKRVVKELTTKRDRATTSLQNAVSSAAREVAGEELELAVDALELAEDDLELAQSDFNATAHMVPATRITRKRMVADSPAFETRIPERRKGQIKSTTVIEETATKVNLDTQDDLPMNEPESDDKELSHESGHIKNSEVTTVPHSVYSADDPRETDSEEIEEGEIREYSDDEDMSNPSSRHQIEMGTRFPETVPAEDHGRKRTIGLASTEVDERGGCKRLRHTER